MLSRIKFPKKCTDVELEEIIAEPDQRFLDYPFVSLENRYLTVVDYQKEQLRRKQVADSIEANPQDVPLIQFMKQLQLQVPVLSSALEGAVKSCKITKDPTPLIFDNGNACHDFTCKFFVALSSVRIAVKRLTNLTLVATRPDNFWLLPEKVDIFEWVQIKPGFATAEHVGRVFPRATAILEHLAKVAHEQSGHMARTRIDDSISLYQVVDVLVAYTHYFPLEELHRSTYALINANTVIASTLYARPAEFLRLISPEAQLESWSKQK